MDPEKNLATIRKAVELVNSRKLDELLGLFAPGGARHDLAGAYADIGLENAGDFLGELLRGAPDMRIVLHDAFASGDRVATRTTVEGTHEGPLLGRPGTGKRFSINQLNIYRFTGDGRITESWQLADLAGFDAQTRA